MPKKVSYTHIKIAFEKEGYSLLSDTYINSTTKLNYICPNGHAHSITWGDFKQGRRCKICANNTKLDYEYVKEVFKKEGYILLSKNYINNKQKLAYSCPNGHQHTIRWYSFTHGHRCPSCAGLAKPSYEFIHNFFKKEGYTLLSTNYINSKTKLRYICPNGHIHSIRWMDFFYGQRCITCYLQNNEGANNSNWRGGVRDKGLPLYKTFAHQLEKYQNVYCITQDTLDLLGVECTYCKKVFIPQIRGVRNRIEAIHGRHFGEANLYCSEECKFICPTFNQRKYPKGQKPYDLGRADQKQWAKIIKERDNYICQHCGSTEGQMIAHHIDPVVNNPVESLDIDNGITLCETCDRLVHQTPGCTYNELRCKS
jgi:5-methylcytosine-specific restriction endonuclease McrA